jgi:hypothetical protein
MQIAFIGSIRGNTSIRPIPGGKANRNTFDFGEEYFGLSIPGASDIWTAAKKPKRTQAGGGFATHPSMISKV